MANPVIASVEQRCNISSNPALYNDEVVTVQGVAVLTGKLLSMLITFALLGGAINLIAPKASMTLAFVFAIGAAALSIWASLSKELKKGAILGYVGLQGLAVGILSTVFEIRMPGIVLQAVIGTLIVAAVSLIVHRMRFFEDLGKLNRFLVISMISVVVLRLGVLGLVLTGLVNGSIYNSGAAIAISCFAITLGALSFVSDFMTVEKSVGGPKELEWHCAHGLILTIVWVYLEILRLLSKLQSRR